MQKSSAEIARIVEETVLGLGYEFVEFERLPRGLLRVTIDYKRFAGQVAHVELFEPLYAPGLPAAGRRKFDGKILSVDDTDETIEFSIEEVPFARTPSEAARAKKLKGKVPVAVPVSVRFPFAEVDRANLIAQLDFKGNKR